MQVGNYALSQPYVCIFCKGKGCSYCDNRGMKQRKLLLIDESSSMTQHTQMVQQHLKDIKGEVIIDEPVGSLENDTI
jgi:hypothetical protein